MYPRECLKYEQPGGSGSGLMPVLPDPVEYAKMDPMASTLGVHPWSGRVNPLSSSADLVSLTSFLASPPPTTTRGFGTKFSAIGQNRRPKN
ncbi:hypothetical protein V6N13_084079 [Hibiscus sabdariffa]